MNRRAGSAATGYALRDRAGAIQRAQVGQIYLGDRGGKWVRFKSALTIGREVQQSGWQGIEMSQPIAALA